MKPMIWSRHTQSSIQYGSADFTQRELIHVPQQQSVRLAIGRCRISEFPISANTTSAERPTLISLYLCLSALTLHRLDGRVACMGPSAGGLAIRAGSVTDISKSLRFGRRTSILM